MPLTNDVLLVSIFGGIVNGFAISLCLLGGATSGGTDFIAVAVSERLGVDAWNYILLGNAAMLAVAGLLFGWDKALYSILFQFASTQIVHLLNPRYKRTTLFIISDKSEQIYEQIRESTHHGATLFHGIGLYNGEPRSMIYSVIAGDQVKKITRQVREVDPHAFINILKTDQVAGNFYSGLMTEEGGLLYDGFHTKPERKGAAGPSVICCWACCSCSGRAPVCGCSAG